jgi:hypothetical protein
MQHCKFTKQAFRLPGTKSRARDHGCNGSLPSHLPSRSCIAIYRPSRTLTSSLGGRCCRSRMHVSRLLVYLCSAHACNPLLSDEAIISAYCVLLMMCGVRLHSPAHLSDSSEARLDITCCQPGVMSAPLDMQEDELHHFVMPVVRSTVQSHVLRLVKAVEYIQNDYIIECHHTPPSVGPQRERFLVVHRHSI